MPLMDTCHFSTFESPDILCHLCHLCHLYCVTYDTYRLCHLYHLQTVPFMPLVPLTDCATYLQTPWHLHQCVLSDITSSWNEWYMVILQFAIPLILCWCRWNCVPWSLWSLFCSATNRNACIISCSSVSTRSFLGLEVSTYEYIHIGVINWN